MQIENNRLKEENEATMFEMTNKIIQLENSVSEFAEERDKLLQSTRVTKERLSELDKDRKDLADELVAVKSNFLALSEAHEKEVCFLYYIYLV